jgi:hypothetical protein
MDEMNTREQRSGREGTPMRGDEMRHEREGSIGREGSREGSMDREGGMARERTMTHDDTMRRGDRDTREDAMTREHGRSREGRSDGHATDNIWPDMSDLRHRFDSIQSEFIDDPKGAVTKAERLIGDVVERITRSMHDRVESMHQGAHGSSDTEHLRQTMRGYRDLVVWMEAQTRRAA